MNKDNNVMERLNRSEVYADYQQASGEASLPNNKCFQPV
jgi:hypothetical protein